MLAAMDERRELIVHGTPVDSLNFPKVSVLIAYFHQPDSQLDLDNIAKGILDGICGPVLSDDSQVTELVLRRVALSGFMGSNVPPPIVSALSKAVSENSEFVLVRAERDSWNGEL